MAEKILVVDDDTDSLKLISVMLQRQGYEVLVANGGQLGLAKATAEHPDLIILDMMMPDMNGLEVCRRLRAQAATQHTPILMFTAKTLIDDKVAGFEAGADDYLTKPTHPAELTARVKQMLARNTSQQPAPPLSAAPKSSVISVIGSKGGIGTTTVALNIAAALMQTGDKPVMADFRLGAGGLGLMLGFNQAVGMSNVLNRPASDLRPSIIERELVTYGTGLRALLSSINPKEAQTVCTFEAAQAMLQSLRTLGDPVVLDLGTGYTVLNSYILAHSDRILLIVEPLTATLHMAQALLQIIQTETRKTVQIVVVTRNQAKPQLPWHQVEALLGTEILAIISASPDLAFEAMEAHTPMVMQQRGAIVASQLQKLAADIKA
ncbi:MAG: response regulator [Armatimonadetes bacterium]|nr:response regulator [Anaerolineae bacterium]